MSAYCIVGGLLVLRHMPVAKQQRVSITVSDGASHRQDFAQITSDAAVPLP